MYTSVYATIEKIANGTALQFLSDDEQRIIKYLFGTDFIYTKSILFLKEINDER